MDWFPCLSEVLYDCFSSLCLRLRVLCVSLVNVCCLLCLRLRQCLFWRLCLRLGVHACVFVFAFKFVFVCV